MRLFEHGKLSAGWDATKQAIAIAEKKNYTADNLDIAFTLATSIQKGIARYCPGLKLH
jgi:hypothetical protein